MRNIISIWRLIAEYVNLRRLLFESTCVFLLICKRYGFFKFKIWSFFISCMEFQIWFFFKEIQETLILKKKNSIRGQPYILELERWKAGSLGHIACALLIILTDFPKRRSDFLPISESQIASPRWTRRPALAI